MAFKRWKLTLRTFVYCRSLYPNYLRTKCVVRIAKVVEVNGTGLYGYRNPQVEEFIETHLTLFSFYYTTVFTRQQQAVSTVAAEVKEGR